MAIDPKFIIDLKGKSYPLYAGLLSEAHAQGLQGIFTELKQVPTEENGHVAIVHARVLMEGGGVYEGYGDASPRNVARHLVEATIRMAETRAKGRALRDAINCGMTMLEELPDLDDAPGRQWRRRWAHSRRAGTRAGWRPRRLFRGRLRNDPDEGPGGSLAPEVRRLVLPEPSVTLTSPCG